LNHDPPDLSLLSSQDYKCEPLAPGSGGFYHAWVLNSVKYFYCID
jgi:hypothetical protein